jgi:enterochelin esterase family protein
MMLRTAFAASLLLSSFPPACPAQDVSPVLTLQEVPVELGKDSNPQPGVPAGTVTKFEWNDSKIFPGTRREYDVYVPANYDKSKPAAVMVFQDGHAYLNPTGELRATVVMDNLIHAGEIPPIIGIFINPGHKGAENPKSPWQGDNRSFEYDTLSDDYAKFLLDEILPEVAKSYNLTTDPDQRAICGVSSGGICAWTVAWQRPDAFRKVISMVGSFTNIRGGDVYPGVIRKTEKKPIRGFFQDGLNDLDNEHGNWPLANLQMQAALKFKGYDYRYVWDQTKHGGKGGGVVFPEAMRWLWRK